jgi:hypothetical protein
VNVTSGAGTTFFTDPATGGFTGNVFCAPESTRNKVFTIYARHTVPSTGQTIGDTIIVRVRP